MYKRKDNDIFGTNQMGYSPRIQNNNYVDPNAAFKRKTQQNYLKYSSQVNQIPRVITAKSKDTSTVNQRANFQDNYHKNRKQIDMQSSIFYPPTPLHPREVTSPTNTSNENKSVREQNFGRKQTLNRQINSLSYNNSEIKGNSSRLFDLDLRINTKTEKQGSKIPLIPHQMQWDQHDSVKYAHINLPKQASKAYNKTTHQSLTKIEESKSTYIPKDPQNTIKKQQEKCLPQKKLLKIKSDSNIPTAKNIPNTKTKDPVQIKILKGWNFKLMQGLSKQCKFNNVAILKFEVCEKDQANLILKRSERWQLIADWLRKDAKLKIRVINS